MASVICPECGNALPVGAPSGLCPYCLLSLGEKAPARTIERSSSRETAGTRIANYRLIEPIGEGGFGTVWLAEQDEPIRRQVALKIIKLGMDTREVIVRFEAERQALALMDHQNIARVFDGGETESGRPYFVMELVKGVRITDYCDAHRLDTEVRLKLFIEVCQAVQHAHQKGVIHRDLKPSNVLVADRDGRPVPKVIDFGIAKATESEVQGKTLLTRFNQLLGTPAYMSPEQAGLGGLDIDTRSDIYSLGVLLYELLTSRPPFSNEELVRAGLDAVFRMIREQEPPKPSTQLSTLTQADLQVVAQRRAAEPARLNRLVRGDLDWIVMKCLEKDRSRRYETANGLTRDLERYLNNEPVVAAAPTTGYRLRKFASRHRAALATSMAFALVLITSMIVSARQAVRAKRFATAETQARKEAVTNWFTARRSLYAADMNLVAEAIRINSLGRAKKLLERHQPKAREPDFRSWEWSYLEHETADHSTASFHLPGAVFNRLGIAPDGQTLAVPSGREGQLQLWDVATRKVRSTLPIPCFQAFFSPDSRWLAAVVSQQGRVDIYDAETAQLASSLPRDLQVNDIAFSPDSSLLAITADEWTADSQMMLRLWRWRDKTMLAERGFPSSQESFHYKIAFHPEGKRLAIGERQGGVRLLRTSDLADEQVLEVYDRGVGPLALSPDGRWLAAGVDGRETTLYVWDLQTHSPPRLLCGHETAIFTLSFSPDSQWLASGAGDQSIKIWEMPGLRLRSTLRGHQGDLRSVGFLGNTMVVASGDVRADIKLWDLRATFNDTNDVRLPQLAALSLSRDFKHFAGIDSNQVVVTGETFASSKRLPITALGTGLYLAAMTPQGDCIASVDKTNVIRLWRRSDGRTWVSTNAYPKLPVRFDFVKNGEFLAALADDGAVLKWTKELEVVRFDTVVGRTASVMMPTNFVLEATLKFHDQDFMYCRTLAGRQVMSLSSGRNLGLLESIGGDSGGTALSWDGRMFAIGNQAGLVELYDTTTWRRLGEPLNCHSDWLWRMAFSPDGKRLITSGSGREPLRLWDLESRQQVCTLPIEPAMATLLQFSADGRSLAFGMPSGQVRIVTVELPH